MLQFVCGFVAGVYATKFYDFEPTIEYIETGLKHLEKNLQKKKR
mgnify:CR=1 FL=1